MSNRLQDLSPCDMAELDGSPQENKNRKHRKLSSEGKIEFEIKPDKSKKLTISLVKTRNDDYDDTRENYNEPLGSAQFVLESIFDFLIRLKKFLAA